jgi:hypothetical protein
MVKYFFISISLFFVFIIVGCGLKRPSIIPLYAAGVSKDISSLEREWKSYKVYYCSPVFNPSAILFLREDLSVKIQLSRKWKKIDDIKKLKDVLFRLKYLKPELYAVVPPDRKGVLVLGYIYTPSISYLKPLGNGRYFLFPVEEQFNDIYYGGDEFDRLGGFNP